MRRVFQLTAVAAALTLVVTGCGTRPGPAAETAEHKGGGELALASPFTDALGLVEAAKQGTQKAKSSTTIIDGRLGAKAVTGTVKAFYDGPATKLEANLTADGETVGMRLVDRVLFIKLSGDQRAEFKTAKTWGKVPLDSEEPRRKAFGKAMQRSFEMGDPAKQLEMVEKTGRIIKSEQTQLNGVPVNHYFVEFDMRKQFDLFLGDDLPADERADVEKRLEGKDLRVPAELWINAEQLPVKMTMDMTSLMKGMGAPETADAKSTYTYSDWGAAVDVSPPPDGEVADYIELMGG
ncbi:hypothetical protein [Amycolatopsis sp. cmx-4-54]|uniref:hypothetical protein n=1 Tax=Amycolatopsis sp. cmx-4-54 TaxID=2790936 RepID=UPI00397A4005